MPARPLEKLSRPWQVGPTRIKGGSGRTAWAARTTLGSGQASVTVSTAMVTSNCLWRMATLPSSVGVGSNSGGGIVINSVVQGVSFALAREAGVGAPWDEVVSWEIVRTA